MFEIDTAFCLCSFTDYGNCWQTNEDNVFAKIKVVCHQFVQQGNCNANTSIVSCVTFSGNSYELLWLITVLINP